MTQDELRVISDATARTERKDGRNDTVNTRRLFGEDEEDTRWQY